MAFAMMRGQFADLRQPFAMVRARTAKIDNRLKNDNQHTNTMKKIVLVCAAMVALLVSCSKDYESKIVGTWDIASIETKITINESTSESEITDAGYLNFNGDGTCDGMFKGISGQMVGDVTVETQIPWNHYRVDGHDLIMLGDGTYQTIFKIKSMSSTKCVIEYEKEDNSTYYSPEGDVSYQYRKDVCTLKKR